MENVIKAISFLLLEIVCGMSFYCFWLYRYDEKFKNETNEECYDRRLVAKRFAIVFASFALLGASAMMIGLWMTSFGLLLLIWGAAYLLSALVEYFHFLNWKMAVFRLSVPVVLFYFVFEPNIWCILYAFLVLVYDLQVKRSKTV